MAILHTTRGDFESLIDGPEDGPLVVLLHGFPELNVSWRHQIPALATAGYRVLAPNQRGYGGSVRDGSYATADLAEDIVAMIEAMGADTATVVGHDWGGGVAWTLAHVHPDRVERLVALNCPPPAVLSHAVATNPAQLAKSWYMLFFQIPRLPEKFVVRHMPRALIGGSYNRKAWNHDNLAPYVEGVPDARGRPRAGELVPRRPAQTHGSAAPAAGHGSRAHHLGRRGPVPRPGPHRIAEPAPRDRLRQRTRHRARRRRRTLRPERGTGAGHGRPAGLAGPRPLTPPT
ncbi:MAG: alpha/beta hydrolase [Micrococcales bacterium]|nr:alpha/beta hydrolase [Micrococcales bacterium]